MCYRCEGYGSLAGESFLRSGGDVPCPHCRPRAYLRAVAREEVPDGAGGGCSAWREIVRGNARALGLPAEEAEKAIAAWEP